MVQVSKNRGVVGLSGDRSRMLGAKNALGFLGRAAVIGFGLGRLAANPADQAEVGQRGDVVGMIWPARTADSVLVFQGQGLGFIESPAFDQEQAEHPHEAERVRVVLGKHAAASGEGPLD